MYLSLQAGTQDDVATYAYPPSVREARPKARPSITLSQYTIARVKSPCL